ncbi:hypothetical protein [Cohnella herbarum]|uniref:Exosporium protein C n=1 Tax=Cohnella herbarum TaxID=2728023 RepID=A0A7Z2ZN27_9BACL|nr:hypothetical protein [Cohnella herbarum]QJD85400.1 hypothetical protein HH215_20945 [Cohnella herbarum]
MPHLLDFNASVVTPISGGVAIPVPLTPAKVTLASVIVTIPAVVPRFVQINATVGVSGDVGTGTYLYRINRGGTEIYYSLVGIESGYEKFELNTLLAIDGNATPGPQAYTLTIETVSPGLTATVIGPIEISASVYG